MARLPLLAAALLLACTASTDRRLYAPGDEGTAAFHNGSHQTLWLAGCSVYRFEQETGGAWRDAGAPIVCVWEGFARAVASGETVRTAMPAPRTPGVWRVRYPVGVGCAPGLPLEAGACRMLTSAVSDPFRVAALCDAASCGPAPGMPNVLCADGESFAGPTGRCLRDPETEACGWEIAECPADSAP